MPHPESEHGLRVQLATALRERDEALAQETYWHNRASEVRDAYAEMAKRARKAEEALAAARRECEERAAALCDANKELALARQASLEHWIREKQLCQAIENLLIDDDERWLERRVAAQALLDGAR